MQQLGVSVATEIQRSRRGRWRAGLREHKEEIAGHDVQQHEQDGHDKRPAKLAILSAGKAQVTRQRFMLLALAKNRTVRGANVARAAFEAAIGCAKENA